MEHKNDYTCVVFFKIERPKKWVYVHDLSKFASFISMKHFGWSYFNVYNRRTGKYLCRFTENSAVPRFV
jgi:hypothetical protein